MKIVNAVAPLRRPTVTLELRFEDGSGIGTFDTEGFSVAQNWKVFVVRHPTIFRKLDNLRLYQSG